MAKRPRPRRDSVLSHIAAAVFSDWRAVAWIGLLIGVIVAVVVFKTT